jgi:hypothetical protein
MTWLNSLDIASESWRSKYVHAFYYTMVTMISVGYGDISPKTDTERIFCVFSMLFCCAIFGKFIINYNYIKIELKNQSL